MPYSLKNWHWITPGNWSKVFGTLGEGQENQRLGELLLKACPAVDLYALGALQPLLSDTWALRSDSAHHSGRDLEDRAQDAEFLWWLVVGDANSPGFLHRFCAALGLLEGTEPADPTDD